MGKERTTRFPHHPALWAIIALCNLAVLVSPVQTAEPTGQVVVAWPGRMQHVGVAQDRDGKAVFGHAQVAGEPGQPAVPRRVVEVLLPPDADVRTVTVAIKNTVVEDVAGNWDVPPVPAVAVGAPPSQPIWPKGRRIVGGRDADTYGTDAFVPSSFVGRIRSGQLREWRLVEVPVLPYRYNPVTKQLQRLKSANIVVSYKRQSGVRHQFTRSRALATLARSAVQSRAVNSAEVVSSYDSASANAVATNTELAANTAVGYAIITTAAIQAGSSQLNNFVTAKQAQGFTVTVVTESTWGGGTGNTAAERIRAWLAANYQTLNLGYVLLIGNPNPSTGDVPMKMTYPQTYDASYPDCPTDYYYAELTGNWDLDGDGKYGEYSGDYGAGGADRNCEVVVGRIPYYGVMTDLDSILAKIIKYGKETEAEAQWRKKALLAMEPSDSYTPGYHLGEAIKTDVLIPKGDWTWHRVYEQTYSLSPVPETTPCTVANVTTAWIGSRIGATFWWTHGSSTTAADIMDLSHAAMLDNSHPAFTFQCSCLNSYPETTNNLTYSLLKNGGICTISGTRVTWYWVGQTNNFAGRSSNASMTYEYAKRLAYNGMPAGDALQDVKTDIAPEHEVMWMNYLDFNIYGDPSVGLYTTSINDDLSVLPYTGLTSTGWVGGVFTPSQTIYTLTNSGAASLTWTATKTQTWTSLSSTGGTLAPGDRTTVTWSINDGANLLASGNYSDTLTFSNSVSGITQSRVLNLKVTIPTPPTITTSSPLPSGTVAIAYSQTLIATNGATPYTWSISAGSLPSGLTLSSAGVISGTPDTVTTASFTVQATASDTLSSTKDFILTVHPAHTIINGVTVNDPGTYMVGTNSAFHTLIITNGGVLTSSGGVIGNSADATGNRAIITGSGSLWSNSGSLYVGNTGALNTLTLTNGGAVSATNVVVGFESSSTGNVIAISGGRLLATNADGGGALEVRYGALTLNSGTVTVDRLVLTNGVNSVFNFNGGTLNSGGSVVTNGTRFKVGNGTSAATLHLLGGTHSFGNGLFISSGSLLTGTGTITGVITNAGSISPGDSLGTLTINNNLTLLGSSLLQMEVAGTSDWLYDQINVAGTLTFGGTLTLSLLDGFTVNLGDRFDLFDFSSSSGSFSRYNLPTLSPLLYWDISELYTSGNIEADLVPPGVIAWGYNDAGQTNVPVGLTAVAAISAGEGYNMALRSDGTVVAWGGNSNGETNVPVGLSEVVAISASSHSMALRSDGTVVAWGRNAEGQTNVPAGLSGVVAIAAGTLHSMVIRSNGTVFAWGDNSNGKTNVPAGLSGVVAIAGSQWHSLALKSNGTVVAWGTSSYNLINVPTGLSNVVAIAAGPYHNMALKSNGTVVAWGDGLDTIPTGLSNVVAIAAASQHSAALKSDGTVVVWGSNSYGQTNMPPGLCGVVAMGARNLDTLVLRPYGPQVIPANPVLPTGVRDASYNHPLQAIGGVAPYSWTVTSGRLPSGLTLDSSGTLGGTPTASGLSCFRVRVTGADGLATDKDLVLAVVQAPTITTDTTLPSGVVGFNYSQTLTASDGATPYTWSLSAGSLPSGLTLSSAGVISGTPDTTATATFTVQVTGKDGLSSTKNFSLTVSSPPTPVIINGVTVNDPGTYMVGTNSAYNTLIITNGGVLTSSGGVIGNSAVATDNRAIITGSGSLWSNSGSLYVGNTGALNTLTLTNGGAVSATNIVVGFESSSTGNVVTVSGGRLLATNADGGGALEVRYGALTLNSGTVTVDRLVLTNGVNSVFNFNGGTLNSGGSVVTNGTRFKVGNGISAATLHLLGGTHRFSNGLFINTNGWLTGTGAITGVITNAGSISPGDSLGILTINNNLTLLGGSLLQMEVAGTSDWLYDQINVAGTLAFGGTLSLSLLDGFTVNLGDRFDLFDFSSSSGSFSRYNLPTLSPLLYWDISELYTSGNIEADLVPPGVIAWGYNDAGQTNVPVGLTAVAAISAGEGYNMALRSDGTVVAWGGNSNGETNVPVGLSGVTAISAGSHSMALRSDGTVVAWGRNAEGQTNVPAGLSGVVAVAAGTLHSMVIRSNGTVFAWGDNSNGKTNVPAGLSGVVAIAGSQWHSLALKSNGMVIAWGSNLYGQTNVPTSLTNVVAIAAGPYHNLALKSNGTVVAWGSSGWGQANVPAGLSNVVAIAAASQHSAALKSDGTVVVWGSNSYGQTNVPQRLCGVAAMGARNLDTLVLKPYGPQVTPANPVLPTGVRDASYNYPLQAIGGVAPYSWTVISGRLPSGLALDGSGILSGTPTALGLSCFRVRVTGANGLATDKDLALTIAQAPTITTESLLASGAVGEAYSQALAASGGATPYTWSLSAGSLPSGLTLSSAGVISGTPDTAAITTFTVQVAGGDGFSSTKEFTLTIQLSRTIINGVVVNDPGTYMVGTNSALNVLIVTNGGVLTSAGGAIGNSAIASNNTAWVTGAGSIWNNSGSLYVGNTGSFSALILTRGGAVLSTNIVVGCDSSSTGNVITVSGGYLLATNAEGSGALEVRHGVFTFNSGTVTVDRLVLTNGTDSTFNFNGGSLTAPMLLNAGRFTMTGGTLSVSGAFTNAAGGTFNLSGGSVLVPLEMNNIGTFIQSGGFFDPEVFTNSGSFALSGGTNMAEVFLNLISGTVTQSGGDQDVNYATNFGSWTISGGVANLTNFINEDHATLTVSGGTLNGAVTIGNTGSFNQLTVTNGGIVAGGFGVIGNTLLSSNNTGIVIGPGSLWSNTGNLIIGSTGSFNQLTIANGGHVVNYQNYVGYNSGANSNRVLVTGADSTLATSNLCVGYNSSFNQLMITNGGKVLVGRPSGIIWADLANALISDGTDGGANNNSVLVSGSGSVWSNQLSLSIGGNGSSNSLTISNGGQVFDLNAYITGTNFANNCVLVDGSGSVWSNSGALFVGSQGSGHSLTISNGGVVIDTGACIGGVSVNDFGLGGSTASNNFVSVTGEGSLWNNNGPLYVGRATIGGANSLTLSNNGTVTAFDIFVGYGTAAPDSLTVSGGNLFATNAAGGTVDVNRGTLMLNSGTVTVNRLLATNFANSVVNFNGGTLNSGSSTVNNGSIFAVGNGTSAANLHLLGGTHSFADGLFINTNSWLTGTGTITGVITNAGSIAPGSSPGVLTVNGDLTLLTNSLLLLELAGTNNALYDQINVSGALTFDGTLTLSLLDGFTVSAGDRFDLFDFSSNSGSFSLTNLPGLAALMYWDTSALYTSGEIEADWMTGSLQVTLAPAAAVSAGAQWQVDGGAWQNSGDTVPDLVIGEHTLAFKTVAGWATPTNQVVQVDFGETTVTSGAYEELMPVLLAAASCKTHGAAGDINHTLNLNPAANPTVEPRKNGPTQLLFTFNKEMMAADGTLDASEFTLTNATYVSASILSSNLTLNLTNAVDQTKVTVVLNGFSDLTGNPLAGTNAVGIRALYGDVNQSGTVNITDMQVIKFKLGSALSATNFLSDINLSGAINITDIQVAKMKLSHSVSLNSVDTGANSLETLLNTTLAATADTSVSAVTLGEALGAPELAWSTDGDAVWTSTMALDGSLMAWSGSIGHLNVSWVETTVTGPGTLSFQWKVSSEADADYLTFSIDGVDQPGRISGEVDWQTLTFNIPSGTHRLTWTYAKNRANAAGLDAGWLRRVSYQRNP